MTVHVGLAFFCWFIYIQTKKMMMFDAMSLTSIAKEQRQGLEISCTAIVLFVTVKKQPKTAAETHLF